MKKLLVALSYVLILATTASADFGRVEMGAGMWNQTPSGTLDYSDLGATGTYTSSAKEESDVYAWLLVKHPIPILPNIRLEYTTITDSGTADGSFNGFVAPSNTSATLNMTQYDIVPYYNILDNTFWTTIDLGLDIKMVDIEYSAKDVNVNGFTLTTSDYSDSTSIVIPLLYLRARVEIPATDIGLETDVKYISYGTSTVSDFRAKVDYTLSFIPVVQPAIEIGYRIQSFDIKSDDEKTTMKIDYSGVYAGLMLRF